MCKELIRRNLHIIDRILLITWLLKDFGWMTTNIFLGFPFGALSLFFHALLLFTDPRPSYIFYNISLLLWVTGNCIWMTIEFVATTPSSRIHVGPHVPLGGVPQNVLDVLVNIKTILFLVSTSVQLFMYIAVQCKYFQMPEEDEEDQISLNEAILCFYGHNSYIKQNDSSDGIIDFPENVEEDNDVVRLTISNNKNSKHITLAYIENLYIIFWISKDLFWSWGTGDLTKGRNLAIFYEATAMSFGTLSILIYILVAYLYRRNTLRLLDCITTVFWISANYVWMCGEFFLRYDNLTYDDEDEGNDGYTRIVSASLFVTGLFIQLFIVTSLLLQKSKSVQTAARQIEMMNIKLPFKYHNLLKSTSPQNGNNDEEDEEEESTVLF